MTTNDVFLDACKGLVMHCNCNILILVLEEKLLNELLLKIKL